MNDFNVTQDFAIDKQDVVTVAIARGEAKIKNTIRELQKRIHELDKTAQSAADDFIRFGKIEAEQRLAADLKVAISIAETLNSKFDMKAAAKIEGIEANINRVKDANSAAKTNSARLVINTVSGAMNIRTIYFEPTLSQIDAVDRMEKARDLSKELTVEAVSWKRKLSDMPSFERQMRAVVVVGQMNKTEQGQEVLAALDKNFEDAIKMIGA